MHFRILFNISTYVFNAPSTSVYYSPDHIFQPYSKEIDFEFPDLEIPEIDLNLMKNYRATPSQIEQFRWIIKSYTGNKNYHNFTPGKSFKDPSAMRTILDSTVF